jgi:hypothetical protein
MPKVIVDKNWMRRINDQWEDIFEFYADQSVAQLLAIRVKEVTPLIVPYCVLKKSKSEIRSIASSGLDFAAIKVLLGIIDYSGNDNLKFF